MRLLLPAISFVFFFSCMETDKSKSTGTANTSWQSELDTQIELNGHRNWILVVDKAFPQQPGMHIINTGEKLLPVLETVMKKLDSASHVKPVIFNDAELQYINDSLAPGANAYKEQLNKLMAGKDMKPMLHDSVFVQMDKAAKLFSITVLKTEEVIPYSSVFLQLDCRYWGPEKEKLLREKMKSSTN